jgi:hypothetical protein
MAGLTVSLIFAQKAVGGFAKVGKINHTGDDCGTTGE